MSHGLVALIVKGGGVTAPLLLCSVAAVAIVLERAWFWWRARAGGDAERVLAAGIRHRSPAPTLAMETAARDEESRFGRFLVILDTIITLSPLLGLLGTVTGMIGAFGVMASTGINQPHAITGGVAEALIATATGLGVAICALVPYNYFTRRSERALADIERYGSRLELLAHRPPPRVATAVAEGVA